MKGLSLENLQSPHTGNLEVFLSLTHFELKGVRQESVTIKITYLKCNSTIDILRQELS